MPYTRTKQHILDFLKHKRSSGTPVEISEAMNKAGHNLNRKQVQKQLSRMKAETARLRSTSTGITACMKNYKHEPGTAEYAPNKVRRQHHSRRRRPAPRTDLRETCSKKRENISSRVALHRR